MKKLLSFFIVLTALAGCLPAQGQNILTPTWLRYLANGSAGPYSCTSGICGLDDERWYTSFTVSPGAAVVSTATNGPFIIRSSGTCTIGGTISNSVNTAGGGGVLNQGDLGGAGGGGGGGAKAGVAGLNGVVDQQLPVIIGGTAGAAGGGTGGNAASPTPSQYHTLISSGSQWPVGGATGGAGGGNGGTAGGKGGNGGGPVILICNTLNFTGTIDASGAPGQPAPANNTGAGGGGGGGYVILSAVTFTANTGTIKVSGGEGGSCGSFTGCGAGGNGGNGWTYFQNVQ